MQQEIQEFIAMATTCNDEEVIRLMKRIVPDYISNNSVYELFDSTYESDSPGLPHLNSAFQRYLVHVFDF